MKNITKNDFEQFLKSQGMNMTVSDSVFNQAILILKNQVKNNLQYKDTRLKQKQLKYLEKGSYYINKKNNNIRYIENNDSKKKMNIFDKSKKGIICIKSINNIRGSIQGHDPRAWMIHCAKETILNGKDANYFKSCLRNKIKTEIKNIKNPDKYVDLLWNEIKVNCS